MRFLERFSRKDKEPDLKEELSHLPPWSQRRDCIRWWNQLTSEDRVLLESVVIVETIVRKQDYSVYRQIRACSNPNLTLKPKGCEVIFGGEDSKHSGGAKND